MVSFPDLFVAHSQDLKRLAARVSAQHRSMQRAAYGTTLADIEGELLYLLIRDRRPDRVFEVSPNAGYSTNYLLAGVTDNGHGVVHTFDIAERLGGRPTESVIRGNQHPDFDQSRLFVHIGDARETTPRVEGQIDLLLLDSCHDAWFAEWYIEHLLPRVRGPVMIQDIVFVDQLEPSTEAEHVWGWLHEQGLDFALVGELEEALVAKRVELPERRRLRSNAVLFEWPSPKRGPQPRRALRQSPTEMVRQAGAAAARGDRDEALELLAAASRGLDRDWGRAARHRDFLEMARIARELGDRDLARAFVERASVLALEGSRQERVKALADVTLVAARRRALGPAVRSLISGAPDAAYWRRLAETLRRQR